MDNAQIIRNYLQTLANSDYTSLMNLFDQDALVHSPLYGEITAKKFYKELFEDTSESTITLLNILQGENSKVAAGHFRYDWTLADGTPTSFECVDIFEFNDEGKIKELRIIYDSASTRTEFEGMKS